MTLTDQSFLLIFFFIYVTFYLKIPEKIPAMSTMIQRLRILSKALQDYFYCPLSFNLARNHQDNLSRREPPFLTLSLSWLCSN